MFIGSSFHKQKISSKIALRMGIFKYLKQLFARIFFQYVIPTLQNFDSLSLILNKNLKSMHEKVYRTYSLLQKNGNKKL